MPEREIKGTGMKVREYVRYDVTENADESEAAALSDALRRLAETSKGPDAIRDDNAETCREILHRAGAAPSDDDIRSRFGDDSAQWPAKQWLTEFDRVQGIRARISECGASDHDLEMLVHCAEELGKLHERMWWRRGIDRSTGLRREQLALSQRAANLKLKESRPARDAANAERRATAAVWRTIAREMATQYFKERPGAANYSAAARYILRRWPKGVEEPAFSTLRQAISKA